EARAARVPLTEVRTGTEAGERVEREAEQEARRPQVPLTEVRTGVEPRRREPERKIELPQALKKQELPEEPDEEALDDDLPDLEVHEEIE
ncbi:MAG: hypothetical protein IJ679_11665, partial [Lachnospiraceae bacterium]|nr:hypothetical protein [Lachnospiraceae bacterium]